MDLEQLRTLLAVAEVGSLSAGAVRRNLTQPAVSLQIKALEQDLGVSLFHRKARGVTLTRAGSLLVDRAGEALRTLGVARAEMAEIRGLRRGRLALGATDAAATGILPRAFVTFHQRYPGIEVRVAVSPTAELLDALRRGSLDLVLGTLPVREDDLETEVLRTERLRLVMPHAARNRPLSRVLEEQPFIAYPTGSTTRHLVDGALLEAGLTVRPVMEIGRPLVMARLVEVGLGVSVLPEGLPGLSGAGRTLFMASSRRFRVERELGLIRARSRSAEPAVRAFVEVLENTRRSG